MNKDMDLSIIVVSYNSSPYIKNCITSIIENSDDLNIEIFVIDNGSTDDSVEIIEDFSDYVQFINNRDNLGFPKANNQALTIAKGNIILLLNPDTIILPGSLTGICLHFKNKPEVGIAGPILIDEKGFQFQFPILPNLLSRSLHAIRIKNKHNQNSSNIYISGACLALRHELVNEIGLLDEDLFWCEDADYCLRAVKRGWNVEVINNIRVVHYCGKSIKTNLSVALNNQYLSQLKFFKKHKSEPILFFVKLLLLFEVITKIGVLKLITSFSKVEEYKIRKNVYRHLLPKIYKF